MLAHWIVKLFWKGPSMAERAKILGLPKNEVLKPVLLSEKERKFIIELMDESLKGLWILEKSDLFSIIRNKFK